MAVTVWDIGSFSNVSTYVVLVDCTTTCDAKF